MMSAMSYNVEAAAAAAAAAASFSAPVK